MVILFKQFTEHTINSVVVARFIKIDTVITPIVVIVVVIMVTMV